MTIYKNFTRTNRFPKVIKTLQIGAIFKHSVNKSIMCDDDISNYYN